MVRLKIAAILLSLLIVVSAAFPHEAVYSSSNSAPESITPSAFFVAQKVTEVPITDFVYDSNAGVIYGSTPFATAVDVGLDLRVVKVNMNGKVVTDLPIKSGNQSYKPTNLAVSADSSMLYVAMDNWSIVSQINLSTESLVREIDLGGAFCGGYKAVDMVVVDGDPNSFLAAVDSFSCTTPNGVVMYSNGVEQLDTVSSWIEFIEPGGSPNQYYGISPLSNELSRLSVGTDGVVEDARVSITSQAISDFKFSSGRIFLKNRQVLNPATGQAINSFGTPIIGPGQVAIDTAPVAINNVDEWVYIFTSANSANVLEVYSRDSYSKLYSVNLTGVDGVPIEAEYLGNNKVALLARVQEGTMLADPVRHLYILDVIPLTESVFIPLVNN